MCVHIHIYIYMHIIIIVFTITQYIIYIINALNSLIPNMYTSHTIDIL